MIKDYSNASTIPNGPYGEDWTSAVIDRLRHKNTIFDVLAEYGIQLVTMNPSSLTPSGPNGSVIGLSEDGYTAQAPLAHRYIVKEISKLGLGGEYNTLQGVKPAFKTMRYIDFICGNEETVQPLGFDPVIDTDIQGLMNSATEDWSIEIAKQRETRYYEQVVNSASVVKDTASLNALHTWVESGYTAAATDLATLTDTEFGQMIIAMAEYPASIGVTATTPLIVNTKVFNMIRDNVYLNNRKTLETIESELRSRKLMSLEGNCLIVECPKRVMPVNVDIMLCIPGTAVMYEAFVRPIKVRSDLSAREAGYEGNLLYDGEFFGGTYQQICMITDNFNTGTGDAYSDGMNQSGLTDLYVVVSLNGLLVQDQTKVLMGVVHGATPVSQDEENRNLRSQIETTASNDPIVFAAKAEAVEVKAEVKKK